MGPERIHYVVSDIHLGGRPPGNGSSGFQMTTEESLSALTHMIRSIIRQLNDRDVELIINGDFIDFLAEESAAVRSSSSRYSAFAPTPAIALAKFKSVVRRFADVFQALREFLVAGGKLTLLLGNHDIELGLPCVRSHLVFELTRDQPARFQLLHDGEAYRCGNVLIEHGNRYDVFNCVSHGALRAYRSAVSRGEKCNFSPPAGSWLVSDIMNPIKERFLFTDRLKPELNLTLPLLLTLAPELVREARKLMRVLPRAVRSAALMQWHSSMVSSTRGIVNTDYINPDNDMPQADLADEIWQLDPDWEMRKIAKERAGYRNLLDQIETGLRDSGEKLVSDGSIAGFTTLAWHRVVDRLGTLFRDNNFKHRLGAATKWVRQESSEIAASYLMDNESSKYSDAARRLAETISVGLVIFGHTHMAKCLQLTDNCWYLNTGAWSETLYLPDDVLTKDLSEERLRPIIEGLLQNEFSSLVRAKPSVASFVLNRDGTLSSAQLMKAEPDGTLDTMWEKRE